MATKATDAKKTKTNVEDKVIEKDEYTKDLEKRFAEMEELVKNLLANANNGQQTVQNITQYVGENNQDVTVTSLTMGELNLSTEGYGRGIVYTFNHIGEELAIPLDDLKKIIRNNKSFIEGGNVFINDDEVIKSQRLTNVYKKLLSYDEMQGLFKKDRSAFEKIFEGMTKNQKETLKRIIFEKLNENEKSVDMNIVQVLNEDMNINIMEEFKNQKELSKYLINDN